MALDLNNGFFCSSKFPNTLGMHSTLSLINVHVANSIAYILIRAKTGYDLLIYLYPYLFHLKNTYMDKSKLIIYKYDHLFFLKSLCMNAI